MYHEILPLSEVKNHLRLDADFTADDAALERMTKSALQFIEQRTNHYFFPQVKTFSRSSTGYIDIYGYPVSYDGDLTRLDYAGKVRFDADTVTVTVGYTNRDDIPSALLDAALMIIESWYYDAEKKETSSVPYSALLLLNEYRRFVMV